MLLYKTNLENDVVNKIYKLFIKYCIINTLVSMTNYKPAGILAKADDSPSYDVFTAVAIDIRKAKLYLLEA